MNKEELLEVIESAIKETYKKVERSSYLTLKHEEIENTLIVLNLLKMELNTNPNKINERVLRGVCDLGMYAFKYFENSSLEDTLCKLDEIVYREIPNTKNLKPLGLDFGNGDPI